MRPLAGLLHGLSMRLEATHVHIKGRLHLGVQLTNEPPGIKGVYYVRGQGVPCRAALCCAVLCCAVSSCTVLRRAV